MNSYLGVVLLLSTNLLLISLSHAEKQGCHDVLKHCAKMCKHPKARLYIKRACRRTCGFCDDGSPVETVPIKALGEPEMIPDMVSKVQNQYHLDHAGSTIPVSKETHRVSQPNHINDGRPFPTPATTQTQTNTPGTTRVPTVRATGPITNTPGTTKVPTVRATGPVTSTPGTTKVPTVRATGPVTSTPGTTKVPTVRATGAVTNTPGTTKVPTVRATGPHTQTPGTTKVPTVPATGPATGPATTTLSPLIGAGSAPSTVPTPMPIAQDLKAPSMLVATTQAPPTATITPGTTKAPTIRATGPVTKTPGTTKVPTVRATGPVTSTPGTTKVPTIRATGPHTQTPGTTKVPTVPATGPATTKSSPLIGAGSAPSTLLDPSVAIAQEPEAPSTRVATTEAPAPATITPGTTKVPTVRATGPVTNTPGTTKVPTVRATGPHTQTPGTTKVPTVPATGPATTKSSPLIGAGSAPSTVLDSSVAIAQEQETPSTLVATTQAPATATITPGTTKVPTVRATGPVTNTPGTTKVPTVRATGPITHTPGTTKVPTVRATGPITNTPGTTKVPTIPATGPHTQTPGTTKVPTVPATGSAINSSMTIKDPLSTNQAVPQKGMSSDNTPETWRNKMIETRIKTQQADSKAGCNTDCQQKCLTAHNAIRQVHNTPPMQLDQRLAKEAQKWADTGVFAHSPTLFRTGAESLAYGTLFPSFTEAVLAWYNEEKGYDYTLGRSQTGHTVKHFLPIVWKGSRTLGCGKTVVNGEPMYVVRYGLPEKDMNDSMLTRLNVAVPQMERVKALEQRDVIHNDGKRHFMII